MLSGAGVFDKGTSVTVSAEVKTGYTFENWAINGSVISTDASCTVVVDSSMALVANVAAIPQYEITVASEPVQGGTIAGAGTFYEETSVSLTATENKDNIS